jgi:hypothetical protein
MDGRQEMQLASDAEVGCRLDGSLQQLALRDLTAQGCMLELPGGVLPKGRRLVVSLLRNVAIPARVMWQRGCFVGLRFTTPLQGDLVQQLALTIRQTAAYRFMPRDRFGRPMASAPVFPNVVGSLSPGLVKGGRWGAPQNAGARP